MMDNCTKFSDLTAHLRELFKSASYSESTVKDMDFILQAFQTAWMQTAWTTTHRRWEKS